MKSCGSCGKKSQSFSKKVEEKKNIDVSKIPDHMLTTQQKIQRNSMRRRASRELMKINIEKRNKNTKVKHLVTRTKDL